MPTGYTADVADGKVSDFPAFALRCARNFGALIMMRDDPMDAPIPDEFNGGSYHEEALDRARQGLAELADITDEQCQSRADSEYADALLANAKTRAKYAEQRARYEAMLANVRAWVPPTKDHVGLKDFMIQQLEESIRFDCSYEPSEPKHLTGAEWKDERAIRLACDIEYHTTERAKDRHRNNERTAWVRDLKASLR